MTWMRAMLFRIMRGQKGPPPRKNRENKRVGYIIKTLHGKVRELN